MSCINVTNVNVLSNPAPFTAPFEFEIFFECLAQLEEDVEWKVIYVGSAEDESNDQELDCVCTPCVPGAQKFVFQADAPDVSRIPNSEILGVTVVLVTASYKGKEFIRVGYYVNNSYTDPELLETPPPQVDISKVMRSILADKPRVTRFQIEWDSVPTDLAMPADPSNPSSLADPSAIDFSSSSSSGLGVGGVGSIPGMTPIYNDSSMMNMMHSEVSMDAFGSAVSEYGQRSALVNSSSMDMA